MTGRSGPEPVSAELTELSLSIAGRGEVSAVALRPPGCRSLLVLGHGAGAGMHHAFMENLALALAEGIVREDDEAPARHVDGEGLEVGLRLRIGVPVSRNEEDRGRAAGDGRRDVEMRGDLHAGERLVDELLDPVAVALERAGAAHVPGPRLG